MQIIFRQLVDPIPPGWVAGVRWLVEAYPGDAGELVNLPFPMGQAWVSDYTPHTPAGQQALVSLDFILTADQHRRQGVGRALYAAIKQRWPSVFITDAISPAGEGFLDNVETWRGNARAAQKAAENEQRKKLRKKKREERKRRK